MEICVVDSEEEAARAYDVAAIQHRGKRVRRPLPHMILARRKCIMGGGSSAMVKWNGTGCASQALDKCGVGEQAVTNFEARSYREDSQHASSAGRPPDKPSSARSVTGAATAAVTFQEERLFCTVPVLQSSSAH